MRRRFQLFFLFLRNFKYIFLAPKHGEAETATVLETDAYSLPLLFLVRTFLSALKLLSVSFPPCPLVSDFVYHEPRGLRLLTARLNTEIPGIWSVANAKSMTRASNDTYVAFISGLRWFTGPYFIYYFRVDDTILLGVRRSVDFLQYTK